jgi:hypothetical protein
VTSYTRVISVNSVLSVVLSVLRLVRLHKKAQSFGAPSAVFQCYNIRLAQVSSVIRMVVRAVGQFTRLMRLMREARVVK